MREAHNLSVPLEDPGFAHHLNAACALPVLLTNLPQRLGSAREEALPVPLRWAAFGVDPTAPYAHHGVRRGQLPDAIPYLLEHCRKFRRSVQLKQHNFGQPLGIEPNWPDAFDFPL
jgi:hypothetical protein